MENISTFLFDLDGTLYLGGELFEGVRETLAHLRAKGKRLLFITNNSSLSNEQYFEKFSKMGLDVERDEVLTSQDIIIDYLLEHNLHRGVFLLATDEVKQQFAKKGIVESNDEDVKTVVITYHNKLKYEDLVKCCNFLRAGARYIITHKDINCPTKQGFAPDVGSFVKLIEASVGRLPDVVGGKPTRLLSDFVIKKFGLSASNVAFVGDRLYTDMIFAKNNNYLSVLVLTGETKREHLEKSEVVPDLVLESVNDLVNIVL